VKRRSWMTAIALLPVVAAVACRSSHVAITVENRTGAEVRLLEVDYPNASFGVDSLASGAVYNYRIQIIGEGPVKVQYTDPANHQQQIAGTRLAEGDQGQLDIVLLPQGKAEFHPQIAQAR